MGYKTIAVTGAYGNLGKHLCKDILKMNYNLISTSHKNMNIVNYNDILKYYCNKHIDYIIHCGAFTKPLKKHEKYPCKSIETNIIGTSNIAMYCIRHNIKLIYISTDDVYNINKTEKDEILPNSYYAWSKLGGECATQLCKNSLIIRGCLCETPFPHKEAYTNVYRNFIYQDDASKLILKNIDREGIWNVGRDILSCYEFAKQTLSMVIPKESKTSFIQKIKIGKL